MKIVLDTKRDVRRLAKMIARASWLGDIPWKEQQPCDKKNWIANAKRILKAFEKERP